MNKEDYKLYRQKWKQDYARLTVDIRSAILQVRIANKEYNSAQSRAQQKFDKYGEWPDVNALTVAKSTAYIILSESNRQLRKLRRKANKMNDDLCEVKDKARKDLKSKMFYDSSLLR